MKINNNLNIPYSINFASSKNKKATPVYQEKKPGIPFRPVSEYYCVKPYYLERKGELLSNTKEFSKYLENKIKTQMMVQSEQDVRNIIDKIVKDTSADEKLVSEVLGRVAQFSSFKQLSQMGEFLSERGVSSIAFTDFPNLNSDSQYIFQTKHMYNLNSNVYHPAFIIDFDNLNGVEKELKSEYFFQKMHSMTVDHIDEKFGKQFSVEKALYSHRTPFANLNSHYPTKFYIVDGWNYRQDEKTKSYTILGAEDSLESTVKSIVNEVQETGKSVDEVLNGEIISVIKDKFGEDFEFEIIKNEKLTDYSAKSIAEIMEPSYPTAKEIEAFIEIASDQKYYKKHVFSEQIDREKLLCAYLDSNIDCYSPQRLNFELKKKYDAIEKKVKSLGKTMDDVYYVVPAEDKSFALITHQYAKINGISKDKIIVPHNYELFEGGGKVAVVLDDFLGSGESIIYSRFKYGEFLSNIAPYQEQNDGVNVILAPIVSTRVAKDYIDGKMDYLSRKGKDFLLPNKVVSYVRSGQDHFNQFEIADMARLLGGMGYEGIATGVAFPTSLPDNNAVFSNLVLLKTIQNGENISAFRNNTLHDWGYATNLSEFNKQVKERVENEN